MPLTIEKALTIEGWMLQNELECLADLASRSKNIAEIGSWMGRSTSALAANTSGKVTAIDTWLGSEESAHKSKLQSKDKDWLLREFQKNTESFSNIQICRMASLEAADFYNDLGMKFDMIFIDASHDYENVKADILAWKPLLAEGGIFCGHDYQPFWTGVIKAVDELVPKFRVVGTIWISE